MRPLAFIIMALLPTLAVADLINISVPPAVREAVNGYRADCYKYFLTKGVGKNGTEAVFG